VAEEERLRAEQPSEEEIDRQRKERQRQWDEEEDRRWGGGGGGKAQWLWKVKSLRLKYSKKFVQYEKALCLRCKEGELTEQDEREGFQTCASCRIPSDDSGRRQRFWSSSQMEETRGQESDRRRRRRHRSRMDVREDD